MERLHILSLQLDGTHGPSLSTFYVPFCQEAPCVFQARACAIKYSKHSHFHSWCNCFFWGQYVCRYVCMDECVYVAQRASERHREAQRGPESPREAQGGQCMYVYVCMHVCMYVEWPKKTEHG